MSTYRSHADEPLCVCGAQLDENSPTLCRKCSSRSRWQRRRDRSRRHDRRTGRRTEPFDPTV